MPVTKYVGEDISRVTGFIHSAHAILFKYDFLPPDFMEILYIIFSITTNESCTKHVSTIQASSGLGLLPNLIVKTFLDNVEEFYNTKVSSEQWAKGPMKGKAPSL
eukprot:1518131-Ditylum_brightwellii.AAC.1